MASTRARGRATEIKARNWLIAQGYNVQMAPMPTRWSLQNDLWGLWDLVGVKEDGIVFCQVKMNRNDTYGKALDKHRAFVCPPWCKKIAVLWEPRKREPEIIPL